MVKMGSTLFKKKVAVLCVLILCGILILMPLTNVYPALSTGDNGRDFYAFQQTAQGAGPYIDYWWVYGPLMPYYYALFFKYAGGTMHSILLAKMILEILSGVLIFLILKRTCDMTLAVIGSIWYWIFAPNFSYTFNHGGVILFVLSSFYFLMRFYSDRKNADLLIAIILTAVCSLVKFNFGLVSFIGLLGISFFLMNRSTGRTKKLWLVSLFLVPVFILVVYALSLRGLSLAEIRQCLPFLSSDRPIHTPLGEIIGSFSLAVIRNIISTPVSLFFALIFNFSLIQCFLYSRRMSRKEAFALWAPPGMALVFLALMFHEYFFSGVAYRTFWIFPFTNLLIFMLIGKASQAMSQVIKIMLYAALFSVVWVETVNIHTIVRQVMVQEQWIPYQNAQIYTSNSQDWRRNVFLAVNYLKANMKDNETFLAIPYDPLYYYLTETRSPSRMTIFFEHIHINLEQEKRIILELEKNNTQFIVLSSRSFSENKWLGYFGKDYGRLLYPYVIDNFSPIASFGDWNQEAGAIEPHAVRIYRRKYS